MNLKIFQTEQIVGGDIENPADGNDEVGRRETGAEFPVGYRILRGGKFFAELRLRQAEIASYFFDACRYDIVHNFNITRNSRIIPQIRIFVVYIYACCPCGKSPDMRVIPHAAFRNKMTARRLGFIGLPDAFASGFLLPNKQVVVKIFFILRRLDKI